MAGRKDDDLLARLNALKPSSVSFDERTVAPSVDIEVSKPTTVEDKLAERLKALRSSGAGSTSSGPGLGGLSSSASASGSTPKLDRTEKADILTAQVRDEVASEDRDPIRDWQHDEGDERTLEDLLEELGPDDQWKLDPEEPKHVDALLKEARAALPEEHVAGDSSHNVEIDGNLGEKTGEEDAAADGHNAESRTEDAEAEHYVKSVLAEIDIERKYGTGDEEHASDEKDEPKEPSSTSALELPSTPQNLLPIKSTDEPEQSQEDTDLEARFSKLGLDLPSTPTNKPSAKAQADAKARAAKGSSKLPKYTDEDIESWCCICNEDGEIKCLGCDDDIYCQNCWRDGHGDGPGQERGHRAVQYTRKGGGLAAA